MTRTPDFDEIAGGPDLAPEEAARLRRAHDLLCAAGPPPELPPELVDAPQTSPRVAFLSSRRRGTLLLVAAAAAAALFGAGYLARGHNSAAPPFAATRVVPMHGLEAAPTASAKVSVGARDNVGNWPLLVRVRGLKPLPNDTWYELYLTRQGKIVAPCGAFSVRPTGETEVRFSVPYSLRRFDGWVVTTYKRGERTPGPVLLST
jgi:hypothetical protein